jgi:indole-3-glycerol phosphate synthase
MSEFLNKMMASQRSRMAEVSKSEREDTQNAAIAKRTSVHPHTFRDALSRADRTNIVAEVKRSSPSVGAIRMSADVVEVASAYERAGAAAISVLTESEYFGGSLEDLCRAAKVVKLPLLRKDFVVDAHQIYEAAAAGASAVLLIVAGLGRDELTALRSVAEDELGMDALVEVHSAEELVVASEIGAQIIGVNNRNLQTLKVTLDTSRELIKAAPSGALMVAESGLRTTDDVAGLKTLGYNAFLIGEALMRAGDCESVLREMSAVAVTR